MLTIFVTLLVLLLAGSFIWLAWRPYTRVQSVTIFGADQSLAQVAEARLAGTYFGIVPRDSIFFVPESAIRADLLAAHPEFAALSIERTGLTSLAIEVNQRTPIARWCGDSSRFNLDASSQRLNLVPGCYLFDANGYVYAPADASSTPLNNFFVYDSLAASTTDFLGATLADADQLPAAFDFARQVATLGTPVTAVAIRTDTSEVDDYLASGTRLTYVLDQEEAAYAALVSAAPDLALADGSLSYVDLRFPGKVYAKKK